MSTTVTATHARTRSRSISFSLRLTALSQTWSPEHSIEILPTEVILDIIELATYASSPKTEQAAARTLPSYFYNDSDAELEGSTDDEDGQGTRSGKVASKTTKRDTRTLLAISRTSRLLAELAFTILYRTVRLSEALPAELFARTVLGPSLPIAGRDVSRLILDADVDVDSSLRAPKAFTGAAGHWRFQIANGAPNAAAQRKVENDRTRMLAAAGRILGLSSGTATAVRPIALSLSSSPAVFAALRTLVVHSSLLAPFIFAPAPSDRSLPPNPTEVILDTYLPVANSYSYHTGKTSVSATTVSASADYHDDKDSALSKLSAHTTHLSVLNAPSVWRLPSETLSAFGGLPNLTHLAVVRRANANEANDDEFVKDLEQILVERGTGSLRCLVVGILPDSGWRSHTAAVRKEGSQDEEETTKANELESYLTRSHVWSRLAALAHTSTSSHLTPALSSARLCVVPARMDAWVRASSVSTGTRGTKYVWWGDGVRSAPGEDFWTWARTYEVGRKTREMERELHERMLALQTTAH